MRFTLINCDFMNASPFMRLSNKAKLLYYAMLTNADRMGFVGNVSEIIDKLTRNDDELGKIDLTLLENDYISAKIELITNTYIYEFKDKHDNEIYVIKHWFVHNKFRENLETNYRKIRRMLLLVDGEYQLKNLSKGETIKGKEIKGNESNTNEIKEIINKENENVDLSNIDNQEIIEEKEVSQEEWDSLMNEINESENENGRTN